MGRFGAFAAEISFISRQPLTANWRYYSRKYCDIANLSPVSKIASRASAFVLVNKRHQE